MTTPRFESLYYTDCVPGQGLRGGAGFQFQAVSPGVSHETMTLVQRSALYEAPVSWMREQRAVEDYPPSLTHVYDGVFATARGRYLGAEANGVREGNQFTHAIATTDPEAYGLIRPAQLWDASWWVERVAPTTSCDPLPAEPDIGPWGVDQLREWVLGREDGEAWLLAVHSALDRLHGADARRVLFVSDDATAVLGWIAAGTLLLAQSRAVRIGFRVFTTNPRQSQHDVIAVHDDWAGSLASTDRDNGFVVFNLSTGRHSAVEPTAGARFWVPRFLRADPYDVLDAIELTQRLTGPTACPSTVDRLLGAVVVLGEVPENTEQAADIVRWLHDGPAESADDVLQPAVEAALAFRHDVSTLDTLRSALDARGIRGDLADRVLRALFSAELAAAVGLPSTEVADASLPAMVEAVARAATPEQLNDVLVLASRYNVKPRAGAFRDAALRFVRWWVTRPMVRIEPSAWPCGPEIVDLLRDELVARLAEPAADRTVADIRRYWWRIILTSATDPSARLDALATAAAVESGDARVRRETVKYVLATLRSAPPERQADLMWRALFEYAGPMLEELVEFLRAVPQQKLGGRGATHATVALTELIRPRPARAELDAVTLLAGHGVLPAHSQLGALAAENTAVRKWLGSVTENRPIRATVLAPVTEPVLSAHQTAILGALLDSLSAASAAQVMDLCGPALPALLLRELPKIWSREEEAPSRADAAVALAFVTAHARSCSDALAEQFEYALVRWLKAADRRDHLRVGQVLAGIDDTSVAEWQAFIQPASYKVGSAPRARKAAPAKPTAGKIKSKDKPSGWRLSRRGKDK